MIFISKNYGDNCRNPLFQTGEIDLKEYDHFLAETEILPDLVAIRGLIRKRFPTVRSGKLFSYHCFVLITYVLIYCL